jgi:hypothetical protein
MVVGAKVRLGLTRKDWAYVDVAVEVKHRLREEAVTHGALGCIT